MSSRHTQNNTTYWIYNDDQKLPVLVMIHGLRGTHHGLDLIAKRLNGYRIIVPDLPGFGESKPFDSEHTVENYVKWLNDFLSDLNLSRPPALLGHSFGSIITSYYAKENPKTISKLILVNPIGSSVTKGSSAIATRLARFFYWIGMKLPDKIGTKFLASKLSVMAMSVKMTKTHDRKKRRFIHNQHIQHFSSYANRDVVNDAFKASIGNDVSKVASNIKLPTLLIAGEKDDVTPLRKQKELKEIFPNAKIVIVRKVGHLTHYETPDQVADAIIKFISER